MKRSGRNESIWVVIHMCMEAMLGISLNSCLYFKLAKNAMSFLSLLLSSLQQNWKRGQNRFCLEERRVSGQEGNGSRGERWPKQCMHI
jgi:hypothetical protein